MEKIHIFILMLLYAMISGCDTAKKEASQAESSSEPVWISLFNGEDFTGWEKFLAFQPGSGNEEVLGVDNDPDNIMSVVDGTIRIDGRIWGALTTQESYGNYHLRLEFKWGEKRYAPRENDLRDSGLLYHCVGPHGAQSGFWMRSHESQIMEGSCGDYHSLDGASIDVQADTVMVDGSKQLLYSENAPLLSTVRRRVIKSETNEKPLGEWNSMELIASGANVTHIVNGKVVLMASNSSQEVDGKVVPLTRGKIQLQSEGAEIFYRNIEIRSLY
jgi:hypothetical protein